MYLISRISKDSKDSIDESNSIIKYSNKRYNFSIIFDDRMEISEEEKMIRIKYNSINGDQEYFFSKFEIDLENDLLSVFNTTLSSVPIYYYKNGSNVYISNSIKLLKSVGVPVIEDLSVIPEFLVYRYVFPPSTIFKEIYKVNPGELLQFRNDKIEKGTLINHSLIEKNIGIDDFIDSMDTFFQNC
jgi:hypothetical protein